MDAPKHVSPHALPIEFKEQAMQQLEITEQYMKDLNFNDNQIQPITDVKKWLFQENTWEEQKDEFKKEIKTHAPELLKQLGINSSRSYSSLAKLGAENAAKAIYGFEGDEAVEIAKKLKQIIVAKGLKIDFNKIPVDSMFVDSSQVLNKNRYIVFPAQLPAYGSFLMVPKPIR